MSAAEKLQEILTTLATGMMEYEPLFLVLLFTYGSFFSPYATGLRDSVSTYLLQRLGARLGEFVVLFILAAAVTTLQAHALPRCIKCVKDWYQFFSFLAMIFVNLSFFIYLFYVRPTKG